jgi:uncharacterized protein with HEPN domain
MTKHDPKVTLAQIEEAAERIKTLCARKSFEAFSEDWVVVVALERLFLIIGKAMKRLPEDLRGRYPEVPWWKIASTRDRLVHGYDEVEGVILWNAATVSILEMRRTVKAMLPSMNA